VRARRANKVTGKKFVVLHLFVLLGESFEPLVKRHAVDFTALRESDNCASEFYEKLRSVNPEFFC
jgi:hypothetical protein